MCGGCEGGVRGVCREPGPTVNSTFCSSVNCMAGDVAALIPAYATCTTGQPDIARHVIECHSTQETRVQLA